VLIYARLGIFSGLNTLGLARDLFSLLKIQQNAFTHLCVLILIMSTFALHIVREFSWQRYFNIEIFEKLSLLITMVGYYAGETYLSFYVFGFK